MEKTLKIIHETIYDFEAPVFIEPHYLRFMPRQTPAISVLKHRLQVFPEPMGLHEVWDAENNRAHCCWFDGMHSQMRLRAESTVRIQDNNPFSFLIYPEHYGQVPFQYASPLKELLYSSLIKTEINQTIIDYGNEILKNSGGQILDVITFLTRKIHQDFTLESREEGQPLAATETFALKKGSCRDLSWLQIQILRQLGIAARFASGYFFIDSEVAAHDLHGWVEIYIPGGGWIGFDPSHGLVAGNLHIPICASAFTQNTLPVIGSFRGGASSRMRVNLSIVKTD